MESRQDEALAVICLFTALAGLFVGARGFSRYLGQNFGWDDYLIGVSMILLLTETICVYVYILLSHTGFHVYDIPKQTIEEQVLAMKWSYYGVQMLYHPMMGVIRASIIMFLFRLKDHRRHIKWALHIVFWINIGYTVSTTIVSIAQCTPVRYAYMRPAMDTELDANGNIIKTGKCIESRTFILASCALSIFMDLIIIPIPTVMVWDLQMRTKTKIFVVIIMSMGWIATAVSAGRFVVYYYRYAPGNKDRTWDIGVIISIVEPAVGIIAACAPALKCLFRLLMPRYFTTEGGSAYPTHTSLHKSTHNRSSRQRKFVFNLGGNDGQSNRIDVGKEEQLYGMKPLGSIDSSERISGIPEALPQRTRSVKTGISESRSDGVEAEPKHILSNKNYS